MNLKERPAFHKMINKCRKKKIDLILTKSVSRFGRNALDMLKSLRTLQGLGVDVYFEQENICLNEQQVQVLLTTYCALSQAESENMSSNIKWGIKRGFENGTSGYAEFVCFGYKRGDDGKLAVDEPDAEIVRRIFKMRVHGCRLGAISDWLYESRITSPTGKARWGRETLHKLLRNEKYTGDVLLQKTFVEDLFSGKQSRNNGKLEKYLIHDHHPAIISRELFEAANQVQKVKQLHKSDRTCHMHGKNLPPRRRFSATPPEKVASEKKRPHTVRSTQEMCDFNTGGPGNDGLPKDPHAAQQGMQPA